MKACAILFDAKGGAISPTSIKHQIDTFGESYKDASWDVIKKSKVLDNEGVVFTDCAERILSSFKMTRRGAFHGENSPTTLQNCWKEVGDALVKLNKKIRPNGSLRDRYLLELSEAEREDLGAEIWRITKRLLPFTMSKTSYGLVGASKILFSVFPEIVLPVDNVEWRQVFKTVDLGDVILRMASDIQEWEAKTGRLFNELDPSHRLTTLPSVYNVMAMAARPKA